LRQTKLDFQKDIDSYLKNITINFVEINKRKIFTNSKNNILESLKKKKSKISESLKSEKCQTIKSDFENILKNETEILKQNLLDKLNILSQNIKNNYSEAYKLINESKTIRISSDKLILFHNFIIEKIGGRDSNINYYYE
jgi:CHAD domain-containing protein